MQHYTGSKEADFGFNGHPFKMFMPTEVYSKQEADELLFTYFGEMAGLKPCEQGENGSFKIKDNEGKRSVELLTACHAD